ncbi:MAG: DUF2183 domain-containing protein [Bifidobacteriaceae bacterium]|jgi:phosphatidate phosphatase APP1|nr:DUF2183 domain-containing protein [Bifidobacteriaceae bacterium]
MSLDFLYNIGKFSAKHNANFLIKKGYKPRVTTYYCYGNTQKVRMLCRILISKYDWSNERVKRGFFNFFTTEVPNFPVQIFIDGKLVNKTYLTDSAGYIDEIIDYELEPGEHQISFSIFKKEYFEKLYVYPLNLKVGLISDIDDTIMISNVPQTFRAIYNQLLSSPFNRKPVKGMSNLYNQINDKYNGEAAFFYLSMSPWNIYSTIRKFISSNGFPKGAYLLSNLMATKSKLSYSIVSHKYTQIKHLIEFFPNTKWILAGDDGQQDLNIYLWIVRSYSKHIKSIMIRTINSNENEVYKKIHSRVNINYEKTQVNVYFGDNGFDLSNKIFPNKPAAKKHFTQIFLKKESKNNNENGNGEL